MRISFMCTPTYADPEHFQKQVPWPAPPSMFDPATGQRSIDLAFAEAEAAEAFGFDMVTVSEHHYLPLLPSPNAAVFAAALTQRLKRVRIGWMGPLVSMSNPVRIAEEVTMLDQLSNGRLDVLFLRGTPFEFLAYGVNPDETRGRTEEAVKLIHRAITEPEPFGWEGRYYRFPTVAVWPASTQSPHPPIYSSGNSPDSAQFAAANRYGMAMSYYPQHLAAQIADAYRTACEKHGWTPTSEQILYRSYIAVGETEEEALDLQRRFFGPGTAGARSAGRAVINKLKMERVADMAEDKAPKGEKVPTEIGTDADGKNVDADKKASGAGFAVGGLTFAGTPAQVVDRIREFHEKTGVGTLDLAFSGGGLTPEEKMRSISLFGRQVLPALRDTALLHQEVS